MFAEEKQLIKMISRDTFMIEKSLWFFSMMKILELAIIISAATKILSRISVDDIVSIDDVDEIEISIWFKYSRLIVEVRVKISNEAIVIHQ